MKFKYGTKVKIDGSQFNDDNDWDGVVVGVALEKVYFIGEYYIVKVTSGQIPNETYQYDTCTVHSYCIWKDETDKDLKKWIDEVIVDINSDPYVEENEEVLPNRLPQEITSNIQREKNRAIERFIKKTGEDDLVKIFTKVFGEPEKVFNWTSIWTFSSSYSTLYACVDTHKGVLWSYDKTKGKGDVIPLIFWVINKINEFDTTAVSG